MRYNIKKNDGGYMNRYKQYFYNSESFFLLRTTGWIAGLTVGITMGIIFNPFLAAFPAVLASILSDFYLFKIKGLKETSFKDVEAFQKLSKVSPEEYDKYASVITWTKPIVLACLVMVFIHHVFDDATGKSVFLTLFDVFAVAALFYFPVMVVFIRPRIALRYDLITIEEFDASRSSTPRYYGVPGYNTQGVYTGSPTSSGGCSN